MATAKEVKEEFIDVPTLDGKEYSEDDAVWFTAEPGSVIEGELVRAFVQRDDMGRKDFRASYVAKTKEGALLAFSEKASFKDAFRKLHLGQYFRLTFVEKESIGRGRDVWRVKLALRANTDPKALGKKVIDALWQSHRDAMARGEDLPF